MHWRYYILLCHNAAHDLIQKLKLKSKCWEYNLLQLVDAVWQCEKWKCQAYQFNMRVNEYACTKECKSARVLLWNSLRDYFICTMHECDVNERKINLVMRPKLKSVQTYFFVCLTKYNDESNRCFPTPTFSVYFYFCLFSKWWGSVSFKLITLQYTHTHAQTFRLDECVSFDYNFQQKNSNHRAKAIFVLLITC